ncbi:tautomerase family protein [Photobacterium sp. 53610]|uniref:tautomerase family protein n=1 Tax=Photobacterium sp. 53610 TaxID=3102789 RepID=UPI002ED7B1D2
MPFTRIMVQTGRSEEELKIISDTLHQTLVDEFNVPPEDRFQVIDEYPEGRLIYDETYLSGKRTSNYILFLITAGKPRDKGMKARFYQVLSQRISEKTGISQDDVMVVIQFTNPDDWSFSGGNLYTIQEALDKGN